MKRNVVLFAGLALIALGALVYFGLAPQWRQRIPQGWRLEYNFIGISNMADSATGKFQPKDDTSYYRRTFEILERRPGAILLGDTYTISDPQTGATIWEYRSSAEVDPWTGEHLDPQYQGEYYVFPRGVNKSTYRLRHSYLEGIPVSFQHEEVIEGLPAYHFSYYGRAEYTESYAGTEEYSGLTVENGQEIRCLDDQFRLDIWVEPVTGEMVKIDESCYAGDYVYDIASDRPLYAVLRWGGVTAGDDVQARADLLRWQRQRYRLLTRDLPFFLSAAGLLCLVIYVFSLIPRRELPHAQPT